MKSVPCLIAVVLGTVLLTPYVSVAQPCVGDCNGDGAVSVDELVRGVNIALATQSADACAGLDRDVDGTVTINELIAAVSVALDGCPPSIRGTSSLAEGVLVLDEVTAAQIAAADATSITFTGSPGAVTGLHPGAIFIVHDTARKVVSITAQNGNTVIQTVQPEFSKVFRTLQLAGTVALSDRDLVAPGSRGARVARSFTSVTTQGDTFTIAVTDPRSLLRGTVVLKQPQIDFTFNFGADSPDPQAPNEYASIRFRTGETADLTLSKVASLPTVSENIDLLEFRRPVPIAVAFGLVQFSLVLTLHLEADGSTKLSTGIHQELAYDAGMTATLNPLTVTSTDATTHDFTVMAPQFDGEGRASAALVPNVNIGILEYSLAGYGNSFGVVATATATADTGNACVRLLVKKQLAAEVYVLLPKAAGQSDFSWDSFVFGDISMEKYPKQLFLIEAPIYDSGEQCGVRPIANAGADSTVFPRATAMLDGTGSKDPTGAALTSYAWNQVDGPPVGIVGADTVTASFTAPAAPAVLTFRLTVTNDKGATGNDDVVVTVVPAPTPLPTPSPTPTGIVPPPAPTGLRATAGNGQVRLTWDDVTDATSYSVYVATASGVKPTNYDTLPGGERRTGMSSPFLATDVTNGTTYYFVVTAVNDAGESPPSIEVAATPRDRAGFGESSIASSALTRFTCVVLDTGEVSCWGGFPGCREVFGCLPTLISGISTATMVAAGANFACVLLENGTVKCWGYDNSSFQLGRTDQDPANAKIPVTVDGITNATAIAAGDYHACAIVSGGTVKCWGSNSKGQLGRAPLGGKDGSPALVGGLSGATTLGAGRENTCALVGGRARCWGDNIGGQLGQSTRNDASDCYQPYLPCPPSPTPLEVTGLTGATAIAVGAPTCAVLQDGRVVCWGSGYLGKRLVDRSMTAVDVTGMASATLVAVGGTQMCADSDGALYCWGPGGYAGELGNGTNGPSELPVRVSGLSGASAVATGYVHTCAVTSGTVQCWGSNLSRMLGVGESNNPYSSNVPVTVTGITNAR